MRIIGIDLATKAKHRPIIADERSRFLGSLIKFETRLPDLEQLRRRALRDAPPDEDLVVVMEATDINWYPVAVYFMRQCATVHVVNPRMAADLARAGQVRLLSVRQTYCGGVGGKPERIRVPARLHVRAGVVERG